MAASPEFVRILRTLCTTNAYATRPYIAQLRIAWSEQVLYLFTDTREQGLRGAAVLGDQSSCDAVLLLVNQAAYFGFSHGGLHASQAGASGSLALDRKRRTARERDHDEDERTAFGVWARGHVERLNVSKKWISVEAARVRLPLTREAVTSFAYIIYVEVTE